MNKRKLFRENIPNKNDRKCLKDCYLNVAQTPTVCSCLFHVRSSRCIHFGDVSVANSEAFSYVQYCSYIATGTAYNIAPTWPLVRPAIVLLHSHWYYLQYLSDIMRATCREQETLGNLRGDALEQRTSTGSGFFVSSGSGFDKFSGKASL